MNEVQEQHIQIFHEPPVGRVVLSRPEKCNAMTQAMVAGVAAAVRHLDAADDIDVIVLEGEGSDFCSGGDLGEYRGVPIGHTEAWSLLATGHDLAVSIETVSTVVMAKVHGRAHAGGLLMSLCADITVASSEARFRVPELLRARPDPFIPNRLIAKVGTERAAYLMFTAKEIDGVEAARIGLVARCVDPSALDAEVKDVIECILATDRASRAVWKPMLHRAVRPVDPRPFVEFFMSPEMANRCAPFVR